MMKFTSVIAFLIGAQATIKVEINNQAIERVANEAQRFAEQESSEEQFEDVTNALHDAQIKTALQIYKDQREILKPAVQALDMYLRFYSPSRDCNANVYAHCLIENDMSGNMTNCAEESQCDTKWANIPFDKKEKLERKFNKDGQQLQGALAQLQGEVTQEFMQAAQKEAANAEFLQRQYVNETSVILKRWGCNSECVDNMTAGDDWNIGQAVQECNCPAGITYNQTNEPFADVDINSIMSEELTEVVAPVKTKETHTDVGLKNGQLQANVRMGGYTTTILLIFALQLIFCFGICCYTNSQIQTAERREEKQKADFYSFLYQFHKQMADEEQAMQDLYGKQGAGGTPGGPAKI